jgi:hypothetical protein
MPYRPFLVLIIAAFGAGSMRAQMRRRWIRTNPEKRARAEGPTGATHEKREQKALQQVQPPAATPAAAVTAWEEAAVRCSSMARRGRQSSAMARARRRCAEGKRVAGAAQLHFKWMALTPSARREHRSRSCCRRLLPLRRKSPQSDRDGSVDAGNRAQKDAPLGNSVRRDRRRNDEQVKRVMIRSCAAPSMAASCAGAEDHHVARVDREYSGCKCRLGIFANIVLPELRAARDPRLLEY